MERNVLNLGRVELVDKMGTDYSVLRAARVSTGNEASKGEKKDKGLLDFLYRNDHISPFSFVSFQFYIKCPVFVARQWMRHRTWDFNEASARYKQLETEYFFPEEWRMQDTENKQGSVSTSELEKNLSFYNEKASGVYKSNENTYQNLIESGIAREQARTVMPAGQYTEFYGHVNMRNLFHFLSLRLDEHAQYEIRVYAEAILDILENIDDIKWSVEAFKKYDRLKKLYNEGINLSKKKFKTTEAFENLLKSFIEENKE